MFHDPARISNSRNLYALQAARTYFRRHGRGLCDLLDELDEPTGVDAFCDISGEFGKETPDSAVVYAYLKEMVCILGEQPPSLIEKLARERSFSAMQSLNWHGARLSELLFLFSEG